MKITFYLLLLLSLASCKNSIEPSEESSQIFFNGDIITMENDSVQYAEAVVEQYGKIIFVGKKVDAEVKYKYARLIDLDGATLLPGFIDPHTNWYGFKYDGLSRFKSGTLASNQGQFTQTKIIVHEYRS